MRKYKVVVTETAKVDIDNLYLDIISEYKSLSTANNYIDGLENTIKKLQTYGGSLPLQTRVSIVKTYGHYIRRINYKKMAIFYTIHAGTVFILRIIPQSMIAGL